LYVDTVAPLPSTPSLLTVNEWQSAAAEHAAAHVVLMAA
jgi:hypothetical protein